MVANKLISVVVEKYKKVYCFYQKFVFPLSIFPYSKYMESFIVIGTVTFIHFLAVISPGPDFIIACRHALIYSRKIGIWTAIGFGLGVAIHIFYSLAGLALVISKSIVLFNLIKFIGAGYLIYIGIRAVLSTSSKTELKNNHKKQDISPLAAVKIGFLTNVLNPKVTLFFLSLFTLMISPDTPILTLSVLSLIMVTNTVLWFSFVAVFLTQKKTRAIFERFQPVFNKAFGGLLIALGIKVALTSK